MPHGRVACASVRRLDDDVSWAGDGLAVAGETTLVRSQTRTTPPEIAVTSEGLAALEPI